MPRVHRAGRLALAAPLIGSLAIAAGCGSSSYSSSSSAAAPAPSSASTAAAPSVASTAAATEPASSTSTEAATTETAPASTAAPTTSSAGSSTAAAPASSSAIEVSADPNGALEFLPTELKAKAGEVTIDFTNKSSVPHSVAIEQGSATLGSTEVIAQSTTKTTVKLKPGTYTFFCTVPGHAEAGMKGTLTVQ